MNRLYLIGGGVVLSLIILFGLYRCAHADGVRDERARAEQVEQERAEAAQERATAERSALDNLSANLASTMQQEITNAVQADPEGARRPVGNATGAALEQLRGRNATAKPRQ